MIKVILFDIDDTLINTYESKKELLKHFGRKYYQKEIADETIRSHWGGPIKDLLSVLFEEIEDFDEAFERYVMEREKFPSTAFEKTSDVLNELSKKYMLGIITNKSRRYMSGDLKTAGIPENIFFTIQTEEDHDVHKPDPAVFDPIFKRLKRLGIGKKEIIYVGDSLSDLQAATGAGIEFYGIADRTTPKEKLTTSGARIISDISELLTLLN